MFKKKILFIYFIQNIDLLRFEKSKFMFKEFEKVTRKYKIFFTSHETILNQFLFWKMNG